MADIGQARLVKINYHLKSHLVNKNEKRVVGVLGFMAFAVIFTLISSVIKGDGVPQSEPDPQANSGSYPVGSPVAAPPPVVVPDAIGKNAEIVGDDLKRAAREAGFYSSVSVQNVYSNATVASNQLAMCGSSPEPGTPVNHAVSAVRLYGVPPGLPCPSVDYATLNWSNLPKLPDSDGDHEPDYKDPFPSDRDRNTLFPDGKPNYGDSGGSKSAGGLDNHRHSHRKDNHHHHGGLCSKKWWC